MGKKGIQKSQTMINTATDAQLAEQRAMRAEQSKVLDAQKEQYRQFEFTNPYENMENVFEDAQVNTAAADFQMEQGAQQRANIMSSLKGAAGSSGVAGLAQALAGQGTIQAGQVSASLSQQQTQNEKLRMQGASRVQEMQMQGAAAVQAAEAGRQSTLLGMEMGEMAGARAGEQAAYGNQMAGFGAISSMQNARMGMYGNIIGAVAGAAGSALSGGFAADGAFVK